MRRNRGRVVFGGPPKTHVCPTAVEQIAPWYEMLDESEQLGFHRDLTALMSKWRGVADARIEGIAAAFDAAIC